MKPLYVSVPLEMFSVPDPAPPSGPRAMPRLADSVKVLPMLDRAPPLRTIDPTVAVPGTAPSPPSAWTPSVPPETVVGPVYVLAALVRFWAAGPVLVRPKLALAGLTGVPPPSWPAKEKVPVGTGSP